MPNYPRGLNGTNLGNLLELLLETGQAFTSKASPSQIRSLADRTPHFLNRVVECYDSPTPPPTI